MSLCLPGTQLSPWRLEISALTSSTTEVPDGSGPVPIRLATWCWLYDLVGFIQHGTFTACCPQSCTCKATQEDADCDLAPDTIFTPWMANSSVLRGAGR